MCALCLEIAKGHITYNEAFNNLREMTVSSKTDEDIKHLDNLLDKLIELEADNSTKGGSSNDKISSFTA